MIILVTDQNNNNPEEPSSAKKLENNGVNKNLKDARDSSAHYGEELHLTSSSYHIPTENHATSSHAFTSDIDQQKLIKGLQSEVAILREDLKSLSKRIEKLENK
jgi:hypothetical protein